MDDQNEIKWPHEIVNVQITNEKIEGREPDDLCNYYHDEIWF